MYVLVIVRLCKTQYGEWYNVIPFWYMLVALESDCDTSLWHIAKINHKLKVNCAVQMYLKDYKREKRNPSSNLSQSKTRVWD